jgi:hypothetical protein
MPSYTPRAVERLLKSYLDIRDALTGRTQQLHDTYAITKRPSPVTRSTNDRPLGDTGGIPWPFMETSHARSPMNGKAKAQFMQELHVSILDLERGLKELTDEDLALIYDYLIFGNKTLDQLTVERGLTSRGSMQRRVMRAVERLTRAMERSA